jgi:hypothetical protein
MSQATKSDTQGWTYVIDIAAILGVISLLVSPYDFSGHNMYRPTTF